DEVSACVTFKPDDNAEHKAEYPSCLESKPGEDTILLPRGSFLFVGGDTAYHVADYSSIHERFQLPFRWAFASVRKYMIEYFGPAPGLETKYFKGLEITPAWWERNEIGGDGSRFNFD